MQNSIIGFQTWGAKVYISPHTRNFGGAVARSAPPPRIDAYDTVFQSSLLLHRMARNIIITASDTAEPPTVTLPSEPLHPNATWPTPSGIDEDEARRICESPILESPIFSLCENYTEESLEFISDSCMLDLLV